MLLLHTLAFSARSEIILVIKRATPSKRDIGTSLTGLVGPAMKPQTLFVFQEMLFCRCFEWMEPPLPAMPNMANAPQIFGSLYVRGLMRAHL